MEPLPVTIIRSTRRKKTVGARIINGAIEVRVPAGLDEVESAKHVNKLVDRLERSRRTTRVDLDRRAARLAKKYGLPAPTSVVWSSRQTSRWGSCTPAHGTIRLSERMAPFPDWVIDYVLVHELAHLAEPNHSRRFHELVSQYALAERAEGFLVAVSLGHAGSTATPGAADPPLQSIDHRPHMPAKR